MFFIRLTSRCAPCVDVTVSHAQPELNTILLNLKIMQVNRFFEENLKDFYLFKFIHEKYYFDGLAYSFPKLFTCIQTLLYFIRIFKWG